MESPRLSMGTWLWLALDAAGDGQCTLDRAPAFLAGQGWFRRTLEVGPWIWRAATPATWRSWTKTASSRHLWPRALERRAPQ